MILIENVHPSVLAVVHRILLGQNAVLTSVVKDFDGTEYRVKVKPVEGAAPVVAKAAGGPNDAAGNDDTPPPPVETNTTMMAAEIVVKLSHVVPFATLNKFGNYAAVVSKLFPAGVLAVEEGKKGVTVTVSATSTPQVRDNILSMASQLRIFSYYPIFAQQAENYMKKPDSVVKMRVPYRPTESMYFFVNKKGDFYVVVSLISDNKDDQLFIRNFLQSFFDAKRLERSIAAAPGFFFTHNKAPQDVPADLIAETETEEVFWCSFQLTKLQLEKEARIQETARQLVNFRNNLMYHIHCCRSYMHALMRKRVEGAVQVISRAKTSTTGKAKVQLK